MDADHDYHAAGVAAPQPLLSVGPVLVFFLLEVGSVAHRRFSVCAVSVVFVTTSIIGAPAQAAPVPHGVVETFAAQKAAGWLTEQFLDQVVMQTKLNGVYGPDYGLMADTVLGLDAAGVGRTYSSNATLSLFTGVNSYVGDGVANSYVEPLAKTILVAEAQDLNPRAFGGRDLIAALEALQNNTTGRFSDKSASGDHSDATSQSLAIIAERRAGRPQSVISNGLHALATLQCANGSFALNFGNVDCLADNQLANNEATAMAILAGVDQTAHTTTWDRVAPAVAYLAGAQSNGNGALTANIPGQNTAKTTSLAAAAFAAVGSTGSATGPLTGALGAAQAVAALQDDDSGVGTGAVGTGDGSDVPDTTAVGIFGLAIFDDPSAKISYETVSNRGALNGAPVPAFPQGSFQPMVPFRLLDTRPASIPAGGTVKLYLPIRTNPDAPLVGQFPEAVSAVALNVTVVTPAASGYVSIWATGTPRPPTSVLNTVAGVTSSASTLATVGRDAFPSSISIYNGSNRPLQLILDATGFVQPGDGLASGTYRAITPTRLIDTRRTARLKAGQHMEVSIDSSIGSQTAAAAITIAAINPRASGYLTASAVLLSRTSTLNFDAGRSATNGAIVGVAGGRAFTITNHSAGDVDVIVDMTGYFVAGRPILPGSYVALAPIRIIDTRISRPVPALGVLAVQMEAVDVGPLPDVAAVAANVTAVAPVSPGYLIVAPNLGVRPPPFTSSINLYPMRSVADGTLTGVGTDGAIAVYNNSRKPVNVIIDVTGFFRLFAVAPFQS